MHKKQNSILIIFLLSLFVLFSCKKENISFECKHIDMNLDHKCDECNSVLGVHVDSDMDHKCDYCALEISDHTDLDKNHKCDYCNVELSEHTDLDFNHRCDYCSKSYTRICTIHNDSDNDARCDYCKKKVGWHICTDINSDGICDDCAGFVKPDNFDNNCQLIVNGKDVSRKYYAHTAYSNSGEGEFAFKYEDTDYTWVPVTAIACELGATIEWHNWDEFTLNYGEESLTWRNSEDSYGWEFFVIPGINCSSYRVDGELIVTVEFAKQILDFMRVCFRVDNDKSVIAVDIIKNVWLNYTDELIHRTNAELIVNGKNITDGNYIRMDYACTSAQVPLVAILSELGASVEMVRNSKLVVEYNGVTQTYDIHRDWSSHDGMCEPFQGDIIVNIHTDISGEGHFTWYGFETFLHLDIRVNYEDFVITVNTIK